MAELETTVEQFITKGMHSVEGWISETDARLIASIDMWQKGKGVAGDLCEIGVLFGRSVIFLGYLTRPGELALGIDYFGPNEGDGDEATARANVARFFDETRVRVINKDSRLLTKDDLRHDDAKEPNQIRIFLVDGGHSRELCSNDFQFAEKVLAPGGVVIVDDFFNREWPGVAEAVFGIFQSGQSRLRPFAIGVDKVYFAEAKWADAYRAAIAREWPDAVGSTRDLLGSPVSVIRPRATVLTQAWHRLRQSSIGRVARRLVGVGQIFAFGGWHLASEWAAPESLAVLI